MNFEGRISGFTMGNRFDPGVVAGRVTPRAISSRLCSACRCVSIRSITIPDKLPLFIGLSVVPYVFVREEPTGPDAGKFLQPYLPLPKVASQADSPPNQTGSQPNEMGRQQHAADGEVGGGRQTGICKAPGTTIRARRQRRQNSAGRFFQVQAMSTAAISLPATRRTINPLAGCRGGCNSHVHGGAGHHDCQRRAALYRRGIIGGRGRQRNGSLPVIWRPTP